MGWGPMTRSLDRWRGAERASAAYRRGAPILGVNATPLDWPGSKQLLEAASRGLLRLRRSYTFRRL